MVPIRPRTQRKKKAARDRAAKPEGYQEGELLGGWGEE
jgi:hypothetical protein